LTFLGIDPGLKGAIAFLDGRGKLRVDDLPTRSVSGNRREIDPHAFRALLPAALPTLVVIEKVNADPHFGSGSSFTFGNVYGSLIAVLSLYGAPFERVTPQRWKPAILQGTDRSKNAALSWARGRWPKVEFQRDDHAEAAALAEFARRLHVSGDPKNG
jgi:hypothetical protein